ncbi:MAG: flagellar biosynthetic protein FliR [Bdellovibrionales bacterium]
MSEVYNFSQTEILLFSLVLIRMTSFVVSWPVFGVETVSPHIKVLFATVLTMMVFPTLHWQPFQTQALEGNMVLLVMREAFIGLAMGFLARFFFFAFRIAGEMVSQAMGLSAAAMFNPSMGGQTSSIEQFYTSFATLFYLGINGHHYLITGLVRSYQWAPPAIMSLNTSQFSGVIQMTQEIIELGLRFSAPVVISILVINLVLGVIGKTVPQLNVLVTSFPINILIGLFLLIITMPMLMDQMGEFLALSTTRVFQLVKTF